MGVLGTGGQALVAFEVGNVAVGAVGVRHDVRRRRRRRQHPGRRTRRWAHGWGREVVAVHLELKI